MIGGTYMKAIRITALVLMMIMSLSVFCACTTLDKTELEEVLNREFDPAGYTDSSYENYLKRYREALDVYQSQNTTAYHIESATVNLLDAIDALVPVADFSQLKAELAEEINPMLYTNASYQVYKTVYDSALIVASNELSKQSVVNNALRTLKTAKSALVLKTDTSALIGVVSCLTLNHRVNGATIHIRPCQVCDERNKNLDNRHQQKVNTEDAVL